MQHILRLVILGRDGILNVYREDHVKSPDEWEPIPGALEAVARLNHAGWHAVVATNQSGIGRGMIDMASVNAVHLQMMQQLREAGGRLDAVFFCPHTPEENCECRKPRPGLVRQAQERFDIDLTRSFVIGDKSADVGLAEAVGARGILVRTGYGESELVRHNGDMPGSAHIATDLLEAVTWILADAGHPKEPA